MTREAPGTTSRLKRISWNTCLGFALGVSVSLILIWSQTKQDLFYASIPLAIQDATDNRIPRENVPSTCPNVLEGMTQGHWKTRPLSSTEKQTIETFLNSAHTRYRLPDNYQRADGRCGNVNHLGDGIAHWFRALCDPTGATPCCYHNRCANKTVKECVCKDCYDMRQMKHAEYSKWITSDPHCPYKQHTLEEACRILNGSTLVFAGDSLVRHVYTAMLLVVTGNMKSGALLERASKAERAGCADMYMFTEKKCRLLLKTYMRACGGSVDLIFYLQMGHRHGLALAEHMKPLTKKSLLFFGVGIHDDFNTTLVQEKYVSPVHTFLKSNNRTWPKLLWAGNHSPGILKSPVLLSQISSGVKKFNDKMKPYLKAKGIPTFETFKLTDGMMSFDGEHYGMGMNVAKANILLSYIQELRTKEKW